MMNLFLILIPIALLDSLNPVTIAVHVYLLGTPQPKTRTATFVAGIFTAYFIGGLVLSFGLETILQYFSNLSEDTWQFIRLSIGVFLFGFGIYLWKTSRKKNESFAKPSSIKPINTFWLGFVVTATDLPTAIPYIAAIERMLHAQLSIPTLVGAIAFYNIIYVLPLLILFGIYLISGEKTAKTLQRITEFINRWSSPVLAFICVIAGILLILLM